MEREINLEEISDGKKYRSTDMAKIGCNDCNGCSSCCEDMGELITLDPYDIYRISTYSKNLDFESMLNKNIELIVNASVLLPALKMDDSNNKCTFLNESGRCSIHNYRPGICRLFPLGRLYEDGSFTYFFQKYECNYENKTKVKIKKWLDTPELSKYEKYISDWHYFIKKIQEYLTNSTPEETKQINMMLLKIFYTTPYENNFYDDFYARLAKVNSVF